MRERDLGSRIERIAEKRFQASGRTRFPTVREMARSLRVSQADIELAVDDHPNLELTSYLTAPPTPLGDCFVEVIDPPGEKREPGA